MLSLFTTKQQLVLTLAAGVLLRLGLFSTALHAVLQKRPELSTPITSFRSLKEGVFIHSRGSDPYSGGVFNHSPLYLAVFEYIIPVSSFPLTCLAWILADVLSLTGILRIWSSRKRDDGQSSTYRGREPLIAALWLFNPYTLLSCLARSTTSLDNMIILLAIASASEGATAASLSCLAIAVHTSLYPVLILPPILMLLRRSYGRSGNRIKSSRTVIDIVLFLGLFITLAGFNVSVAGREWVSQTWGVILTISDLTPNVGMHWYFFTEMFDHFRPFFVGVFQLHTVIYVAPINIRLRHDPLLAILVTLGVISTWKSFPTLGDTAVLAGLLSCFPEVISNLRHPLFSLTVQLYTVILLPLLHSLWLLTGTGNANFFYAATMVYGLNAGLAVADILGAGVKANVKAKINQSLNLVGSQEEVDKTWEKMGWSIVQMTNVN